MAIQQFNKPTTVQINMFGKVIWYISFILIIPIFVHIGYKNSIKRMQTKINQADSEIDVQLTKRRDLLIKLVDSVKQALKFEKDTLTQVTQMRNQNFGHMSIDEKQQVSQTMDSIHRGINIQLEAYPNLKGTQNVLQLQQSIVDVEEDIAASRRIYNSNVSYYNQSIQAYPMTVAASGLTTYQFFEATKEQKQDVKIDLGFN